MEDKLIVYRLKSGDESAFKFIFDTHYVTLCRFANQLLHDAALAEEVVDDAIFYLWEHREELVITHSIRAYLMQSVRNRSINELNTASRRYEQSFSAISTEENIAFLENIFEDDAHPMGMLLQEELENCINDNIEKLPEECRKVFKMSRFGNKKQEEIAKELNISVNTVKYHIKNALAFLRRNLSQYLASIIIAYLHLH